MHPKDLQRRRITGALFIGNALASTAYIAAITIAALAAQELTGSPRLAGVPNALGTVGATLGASLLTALSARRGRLFAFPLGFFLAAVGATVAASALPARSLTVLLGGMVLIGFGRSVAQLSRFAAGDLWPSKKRASAIGFVVWAATIGAVAGPLVIVPASRFGTTRLGAELAGPFAFAALAYAVAGAWYLIMLRPEPLTLVADPEGDAPVSHREILPRTVPIRRTLPELLRLPEIQLPLLVLTSSQLVMVFLMTMMPLHVRAHHHGLTLVSGVMMLHTLGMYAIAPLTGLLIDRLGGRPMIALGGFLMVIACLLGAASGDARPVMISLSLFLLGIGWNFCFVAASAMLQKDLPLLDALRLQGFADSAMWACGGVGALASGFIMAAWSFQGMSLLGSVLAFIPWIALRRAPRS